jgi:adenylylsulfate kinase
VDTCAARDPKGLYKKARAGEIPEFTGVSAPYEAPLDPELVLDTNTASVEENVSRIIRFLEERGYLSRETRPETGEGPQTAAQKGR